MRPLKTLSLSQNLPGKFEYYDLQSTQQIAYHTGKWSVYMSASMMLTDLPAVILASRNLLIENSHITSGFIYHFLTFSVYRSNSMVTKPKTVSNTDTP